MKRIMSITISIIVCLIISINVFALTPPSAVTKAFATKFPKATNVKWGKESKAEYEANFKQDGVDMSANFSDIGEWVETEKEIPISEIPAPVKAAIMKKYPSCKITGGDMITPANGKIKYEADLTIGNKKSEVQCDAQGNFVK